MTPQNHPHKGLTLRGSDMDQLDTIVHDLHYIRGRLDKHVDENTAAHAGLKLEVADLRTDVAKNGVIIDNKVKGWLATGSASISAIVAGIIMYFNGGSG